MTSLLLPLCFWMITHIDRSVEDCLNVGLGSCSTSRDAISSS